MASKRKRTNFNPQPRGKKGKRTAKAQGSTDYNEWVVPDLREEVIRRGLLPKGKRPNKPKLVRLLEQADRSAAPPSGTAPSGPGAPVPPTPAPTPGVPAPTPPAPGISLFGGQEPPLPPNAPTDYRRALLIQYMQVTGRPGTRAMGDMMHASYNLQIALSNLPAPARRPEPIV